jgi:hypothetical protein
MTPSTGDGNSAFTLSVSTMTKVSPSLTLSPSLKCHFNILPSWIPSPISANLKSYIVLFLLRI